MNKISSKDYFIKSRRGARRQDSLEFLRHVQENRIEASTIYIALIDSRGPRTTNALPLFNAIQGPPVTGLFCPASLGSSALMFARDEILEKGQ
jgi:hypothetical protein